MFSIKESQVKVAAIFMNLKELSKLDLKRQTSELRLRLEQVFI